MKRSYFILSYSNVNCRSYFLCSCSLLILSQNKTGENDFRVIKNYVTPVQSLVITDKTIFEHVIKLPPLDTIRSNCFFTIELFKNICFVVGKK